ncbi:helix-turn-helix domain-containing protein [Eubacterium sp.]
MDTREIIQSVIDYIDDNLDAEFTVDDLCNLAGYSYVHLCRLFNLHIGLSPKEYINRRKLLFAVYEMRNDISKIDIAMNYGFNTYAGFYKAFKREFCCSPSEFIKSYIGNKPYKINILQEEHIMVSKTRIQKLLSNWDLQDNEVTNIINENTGRQNENAFYIGNDYVIKYSANLASIKKTIMFADVVELKNGDDYLQNGDLYFVVINRIKGKQLKCEDIFADTGIAYTIGINIAKLHNKLKAFDNADFKQVNIYNDCVESIYKIQNLTQEFIEIYKNTFGKIINQLPTQVIHRDINPSNMIFDNGEFKGFIDFDLTEINVRIFDICYCATAMLSECFSKPNVDINKWLEILDNLVEGYDSINKLSDSEKQAMPYVIYSIQIICISYFSQYDKYIDLTDINTKMLKWLIENL